jgi:cation transport ATPase
VYKRCCLENFFRWYCKRPSRGKKKRKEKERERQEGADQKPSNRKGQKKKKEEDEDEDENEDEKEKEEEDEDEKEKEEEEEDEKEKEEEEEEEEEGEANNKPRRDLYINFLIRDVANMTVHFLIESTERKGGHVFSQFYSELVALFNAAKVIPFKNKGYENLVVDPSLIDALGYASGARVFKVETYERGYLASKYRAHHYTQDA